MLIAKNVSLGYGENTVVDNVNLSLRKGEKIALVGPNGSGKSTILKALAGKLNTETGAIINDDTSRIGYIPQVVEIESDETIITYIKRVIGIKELEDKLETLSEKLDDPNVLEEYGNIQEQYLAMDGYAFEHHLMIVLAGFGLDKISHNHKISTLSGGQKSKIAIAAMLLSNPDLLLLDEPTNNLDLPSIIWLETFLTRTEGGCLIVSHDQDFIDRIVSKLIIVNPQTHTVTEHIGSYTDYIEHTKKARLRQAKLYTIQQREIKQMQDTVDKKKRWANKGAKQTTGDKDKYLKGYQRDRSSRISKSAKALEKQIERMQDIDKPQDENSLVIPLNAKLDSAKHSIAVSDLVSGYKKGFQLGPINIQFNFGSRTAIIGSNGSGKTTLLRTITGEIPLISGSVSLGPSLIIGSITQELLSLPQDKAILDFLLEKSDVEKHLAYNIMHRFGFPADNAKKKIQSLSPGEQMRLLIACYSLLSVNTLVLDEPTNHLDLEALSALEILLGQYEGTVILVSHDRHLLEIFDPDQIFMIEDHKIHEITNYTNYLEHCYKESQRLIQEFPANQ